MSHGYASRLEGSSREEHYRELGHYAESDLHSAAKLWNIRSLEERSTRSSVAPKRVKLELWNATGPLPPTSAMEAETPETLCRRIDTLNLTSTV